MEEDYLLDAEERIRIQFADKIIADQAYYNLIKVDLSNEETKRNHKK